jgi:hypothetical protein
MQGVMRCYFVCLLFLSLAGCSTSYKPNGLTGGYSDMRLSNNTYKVSFRGNGFTSQDKVQNLLLRRCAELTKQNKYRYFVILTGRENHSDSQYTTPASVDTYGYGNVNSYGYAGANYYGNSHSTITPGQTYHVRRYTDAVMIKMLHSRKKYANALDARIILNDFDTKSTGSS